jgi:hypothetical protein
MAVEHQLGDPLGQLFQPGVPSEVRDLLQQKEIADLVARARSLVQALFPHPQRVWLERSRDPEEGDVCIVVCVEARATPTALREAYRRYIQEWVRATPPDVRRAVRLSHYAG